MPVPQRFFGDLSESQLITLFDSAEIIELKANTTFIHEGENDPCFYYIMKGAVSIFVNSGKKEYVLATLTEGETVGEMALIDESPRSASVKTLQDMKLYKFDINKLKNNPEASDGLVLIRQKISTQLSDRLRYTNAATVSALEKKYVMGVFSVRMLALMSVYALSLNVIELSERYFSNTTWISTGLIIIFLAILFSIVRKSGYPFSFYGLNTNNLFKNCTEGILFSIPLMALVVLIKWSFIHFIPSLNHLALFDPAAATNHSAEFNLKIYLIAMLIYALFCPAQEFIGRGCIQTSLQNLMDGKPIQVKWQAIIISNLIFASAHSHLSVGFALTVFIPGIFWGWLFYRHKSLVGVSISHVLIGVWAVFFLGIQSIM